MLFDDLVRGLFGDLVRSLCMRVKLVINDLVRSRATDLVRGRVLRAYVSPNGYLVRTLRRGVPKLVFGCGGGLVRVLCDSCSAAEGCLVRLVPIFFRSIFFYIGYSIYIYIGIFHV